MICPNCQTEYPEEYRFCSACGAPLESVRKGSHWVPIVIMAGLTMVGITAYFLIPLW